MPKESSGNDSNQKPTGPRVPAGAQKEGIDKFIESESHSCHGAFSNNCLVL